MLPLDAFHQIVAPVAGSLPVSALVAAVPLVVLFVLLGVFKAPAWASSVATLCVCVLLSVVGWRMPAGQALSATAEGVFFGACQIMWILIAALWLYNLTVTLGWDAVLRGILRGISDDLRVLSLLVAFAFGALLEGLAGFGAPVAIAAAMLASTGMPKLKAAAVAMVGNTAPVTFGAIGAPITALGTAAASAGLGGGSDPSVLAVAFGVMGGRQSPVVAILVPLFILAIVDGKRGLKDCWPVALVCGLAFAAAQFVCASYLSYMITDIVAGVFCLLVMLVLLRFVQPGHPMRAEAGEDQESTPGPAHNATGAARIWGALAPYAIIVALFSLSQLPPVKTWVSSTLTTIFTWPGLNECKNSAGTASCVSTGINLYSVLSSGCYLALGALITTVVYRMTWKRSLGVLGETIASLRFTIVTIAAVLGIAYVMNASGMTISLGTALASAGAAFAFVSPVLGWLGVAITGSDTSSNALFGGMQVVAAQQVWPGSVPHEILMATSNSTGGGMGKMISPQSLSVAAAAVDLPNKEGEIFRRVLGWSVSLLIIVAVLVTLQATVLTGMIPVP